MRRGWKPSAFEANGKLTGFYKGRPLSGQSIWSSGDLPPLILLDQDPLLNERVETGVALSDLVNYTIVHEVGLHFFGLSDEEMQASENDLRWPSGSPKRGIVRIPVP